ncbi:unnamed protein product [Caenorhabditis nigoni]
MPPKPTKKANNVPPQGVEAKKEPDRVDTEDEITIPEEPEEPQQKQEESPQHRRPRAPINEIPVATTKKYVVYSRMLKLPDDRKNGIHKFHSIAYHEFFGTHKDRPRENIEKWKSLERNWPAESIPVSPFDQGALRILVWRQFLPDPLTHYEEIEKRIPSIHNYPKIKEWLLYRSRGTLPGAFSKTKGNNWCRTCGCNLFGYPIDAHQSDQCPLADLPWRELLAFQAVNSAAYCPFCASRSARHLECSNQSRCSNCNKWGHQEFQKLCEVPNNSVTQQREMANEDRLKHYRNIRTLLEEKKLRYWMPGDDLLRHYVPDSIRMAADIRGWSVYTDPDKQIPFIPQMERWYLQDFRFRGLVTPEADAAHTNDLPMFQPDEMDTVEDIADEIDYAKYHKIPQNRRGDGITFVTPTNLGQRLRHRRGVEREERREKMEKEGYSTSDIEYELYNESDSSDGWGQIEYLIDGWEVGNIIPQQHQAQVSTNSTPSSSTLTVKTEAKNGNECSSNTLTAQTSHSSEEKVEIPVPPATIPKPPILVPKAIPVDDRKPNSSKNAVATKSSSNTESYKPTEQLPPNSTVTPNTVEANKWFSAEDATPGKTLEEELRTEQANSSLRAHGEIDAELKMLQTKAIRLEAVSQLPIPWTQEAIHARLVTISYLLTGENMECATRVEMTTPQIGRSYARYLQGAAALLAEIKVGGGEVRVIFTPCPQEVLRTTTGHSWYLPTIKRYEEHDSNYWIEHATENWTKLAQWLSMEFCSFIRLSEHW